MTAIIDYGERPAYLLYQLEKLGVDQKFTSVESEILAADRIILPDCSDIKKALKRLHLLNLFLVGCFAVKSAFTTFPAFTFSGRTANHAPAASGVTRSR